MKSKFFAILLLLLISANSGTLADSKKVKDLKSQKAKIERGIQQSRNELQKTRQQTVKKEQTADFIEDQLQNRLEYIHRLENEIDDMERDYQLAHINRLNEGKCSAQAGIFFSDIVSELERIADHAMNIAFAVTESRSKDESEHLAKIVLK